MLHPFALAILLCTAGPRPTGTPAPEILDVRTAPDLNALFERNEGWTGGDGVISAPLAPGRNLWLFADTWVGKVKDGKRVDATIVNNSAVVQEGIGKSPNMRFFIRRDAGGKAGALLTPQSGGGWFWPQAAVFEVKRLFLFLTQVERTVEPGPFGFRLTGQSLGIVRNPLEAPTQWQVEQRRLPFTDIRGKRELTFGAALLRDSEHLYIYGVDDIAQGPWRQKNMVLARAPLESVADFRTWRFYREGQWITDAERAGQLVTGVGNDYSVTYHRRLKCYVLVSTENGLSPNIMARTAPAPWGPWSLPAVVYKCPEAGWNKNVFCYGGRAHPELARDDDELVINYVANSFDFWQLARDARLYWPRFIVAKIRPRS
jgi:hypothetical protein